MEEGWGAGPHVGEMTCIFSNDKLNSKGYFSDCRISFSSTLDLVGVMGGVQPETAFGSPWKGDKKDGETIGWFWHTTHNLGM